MIKQYSVVACIALACLAETALSEGLPFDLRLGVQSSRSNVVAKVSARNVSPSDLRNLWIEARLGDTITQADSLKVLVTNTLARFTLDLGRPPAAPGLHTLAFQISWQEANGGLYTVHRTVPLSTVAADEPGASPLSAQVACRDGKVQIRIRSSGKSVKNCSIRLILPAPLKCRHNAKTFGSIAAGADITATFDIDYSLGGYGVTYPVLAIVDAEADGIHTSVSRAGILTTLTPWQFSWPWRKIAGWTIAILVILFVFAQFVTGRTPASEGNVVSTGHRRLFDICVLTTLGIFLLVIIPPQYILKDTMTIGGDTPAHNYIASHLKDQISNHGSFLPWANGWWGGFPLLQFYFPLPYIFIAGLDLLIPFNIAFKLVSVLGILSLPLCAYACARLTRLPAPGPVFLAAASMIFLFDSSHVMWGGNIASTLAGMISNSISFSLMLLALGSVWRDMNGGKVRILTILLLAALALSHFFTSIVAAITIVLFPLLRPEAGIRKAMVTLASEAALAFLLTAWWLMPLMAKQEYTVGFGGNWNVGLLKNLVVAAPFCIPLAIFGLGAGILAKSRFVAIFTWMAVASCLLFTFGQKIAPVFVNIRLWPFVMFGALAVSAAGLAIALSGRKALPLLSTAVTVAALAFGLGNPAMVHEWAKWNYSGLEENSNYDVMRRLVLPIKGTPGRLANDLHADNEMLGSSRIFECVPHLTGKPVLEGGLVSAASGSLFSYYIQTETSENPAGFPNMVRPGHFDITNATKHLELFNVSHFIARGSGMKSALSGMDGWRMVDRHKGWELHKLASDKHNYVFVPEHAPAVYHTDHWKECALEWFYRPRALDQPFAFLGGEEKADRQFAADLSDKDFLHYLFMKQESGSNTFNQVRIDRSAIAINEREVSDRKIRFTTTGIGLPHIIKISYYPNWKVTGADRIYIVTPCFMLVYPTSSEVVLHFGSTASDLLGRSLSALGLVAVITIAAVRLVELRRRRRPVAKETVKAG